MSHPTSESPHQKVETDYLARMDSNWNLKDSAKQSLDTVYAMSPFAGHKIFHAICQSGYKADYGAEAAPMLFDPLEKMGFVHFPKLLSEAVVKELKDMTEHLLAIESREVQDFREKISQRLKQEWGLEPHVKNVVIPTEQIYRLHQLGTQITKSPVGRLIQAHYQSYFQIAHCLLYRTQPTDNPKVSFQWHRDIAPDSQTHLMLFLQDGKEDGSGGMIEFLPRPFSDLLEKKFKYALQEPVDRVADLRQLGVPEEVVKSIYRPNIKAGDGILFRASKILHKGIAPKTGVRDVLSYVFLPSPNPWKEIPDPQVVEKWRIRVDGFDSMKTHPLEL